MTWRSYLQSKTRQPEFLWRMVIGILVAGVVVGYALQAVRSPQPPSQLDEQSSVLEVEMLRKLAEQGEWLELWWAVPKVAFRRFETAGAAVLSAIAACCWFAFLWQALQTPGWRDLRLWCALLAVPLGMLSIWPTHFMALWQEQVMNLHDSVELIPGIRYFVLGVGLREELAKLLLLLPLMPILARRSDELTALLVAACVGLGFAAAENVSYFGWSGGADAMGRFLTANPFHMSSTGLIGLALYRAIRNPQGWASHSAGVFGVLAIAHGLYDSFIALPDLAEYAILSQIIFALLVYQFFHELRGLRTAPRDVISLSATFLFGVSFVTAATFVYLSATLGTTAAFDNLTMSITGLAVMVYLFLREMPETMVTV